VVGSTEEGGERIVRGSVEDKSFSVLYLGNERPRGAFLLEQLEIETAIIALGREPGGGLVVMADI
jgi:hypothetical protein